MLNDFFRNYLRQNKFFVLYLILDCQSQKRPEWKDLYQSPVTFVTFNVLT